MKELLFVIVCICIASQMNIHRSRQAGHGTFQFPCNLPILLKSGCRANNIDSSQLGFAFFNMDFWCKKSIFFLNIVVLTKDNKTTFIDQFPFNDIWLRNLKEDYIGSLSLKILKILSFLLISLIMICNRLLRWKAVWTEGRNPIKSDWCSSKDGKVHTLCTCHSIKVHVNSRFDTHYTV